MSATHQSRLLAKAPSVLLLSWFLLVPGCGSKDTGAPLEIEPIPTPVASASPPIRASEPAVIPAVISWGDSHSKVPGGSTITRSRSFVAKKGGNLSEADREILLPSQVPKRIRITLQLPEALSAPSAIPSGEARLISKDSESQALKVEFYHGKAIGELIFEVAGIDEILPSDREEKVVLVMRLTDLDRNTIPLAIRLTLATPPSRLEIQQSRPEEYLSSGRSLPEGVRSLRARISRWDLLQVVTAKNRSQEPIRVEIPAILNGKISTHYRRVTVAQQPCRYGLQDSQWDEVLGSELYLLPIDQDLPNRFSSILSERLAENRFRFSLAPDEERVFGIYGSGGTIPNLMDQGYSKSVLQSQVVISGCHSTCGDPRTEMSGWNIVRAEPYWKEQGFPGSSKACVRAQCAGGLNPGFTPDLCNDCAIWELANGTAPWDFGRRFCWGDGPGNPWGRPAMEHWHVQKFTQKVNAGLETSPVVLEINEDSQRAILKFETSPDVNQAEERSIPFLKGRTVQFE